MTTNPWKVYQVTTNPLEGTPVIQPDLPYTPPAHHRRFYVVDQNRPENAEPLILAEGIAWRDGKINVRGDRNGQPGSWFYNNVAALEFVVHSWAAEILWIDRTPEEIEDVDRLRRQVAAAVAASEEDSENESGYAPKYLDNTDA